MHSTVGMKQIGSLGNFTLGKTGYSTSRRRLCRLSFLWSRFRSWGRRFRLRRRGREELLYEPGEEPLDFVYCILPELLLEFGACVGRFWRDE